MKHPLVTDPSQIPRHQPDRNQYQRHPEHERGPQAGDDVGVLEGEAEHGSDPGVEGEETHREGEGTGDGDEGVFGPDAARAEVVSMGEREGEEAEDALRDQSRLRKNGQERREVQRRSPDPLTADPALSEDETLIEDDGGDGVDDLRVGREVSLVREGRKGEAATDERVDESVGDPLPENSDAELESGKKKQRQYLKKKGRNNDEKTNRLILLSQLIKLWIPIQHPRPNKLIEHTQNDRRKNGEDDVVEREGPSFFEDLPREGVLEGEPETGHVEGDVFVETVEERDGKKKKEEEGESEGKGESQFLCWRE
jgi:hypothetical protein